MTPAILKMNFNFNFKDMPLRPPASIRVLTMACDPDHTAHFRPRTAPRRSQWIAARSRCIMVGMHPTTPVRRLKTYAGAQGFVYQYYFVGKRAALPGEPEAPATEFVFDVTSDRKLTYAVSVFLLQQSVSAWTASHARPLNDAEQYAAAKLRLFRAFDDLDDVKTHGRRLVIGAALLEEALSTLGVD